MIFTLNLIKNIRRPFRKFTPRQIKPRSNEQIRIPEVRLINEKGENIGIVETQKALQMAKQVGLDLVEISKDAKPPVAKIIDMGKYLYQQEKAKKERKAKQKSSELKVIKVGLSISDHDAMIKIKKLEKFLEEGDKVKVEIFLKGRQRANKEFAREKFKKFIDLISLEYKTDQSIKSLPSGFSMIISK